MPINAKHTAENLEKNLLFASEMSKKMRKFLPALQEAIAVANPDEGKGIVKILELTKAMSDQLDTWKETLTIMNTDLEALTDLYTRKNGEEMYY